MGGHALLRDSPQQHDDLVHHQLGDAAGVAERGVEHRNAPRAGGRQIDLVGADAKAADREQRVGSPQRRLGQPRAAADAEQVHAGEGLGQRGTLQRPWQTRHVGDAGAGEQVHSAVRDALEQQDAHPIARRQGQVRSL